MFDLSFDYNVSSFCPQTGVLFPLKFIGLIQPCSKTSNLNVYHESGSNRLQKWIEVPAEWSQSKDRYGRCQILGSKPVGI